MAIPRITLAAEGLGDAGGLNIPDGGDIRQTIIDIVNTILSYVALLAVVMVVLAGVWMIVSAYDDSAKEKAKKMITYTIIGLLIILLAKAIINIFVAID